MLRLKSDTSCTWSHETTASETHVSCCNVIVSWIKNQGTETVGDLQERQFHCQDKVPPLPSYKTPGLFVVI